MPKKLNFYGLGALGYAEAIPLVGDWNSDQLAIEMVCFRISHRRREGGLGKFGHFKRIVDLTWNNEDLNSHKKFIWCREAEAILRECCLHDELGIAGPTSLGKTEPMALWMTVNYICDPTHVKCFVMSTTLQGAKDRVWGRIIQYLDALPDYPGKQVKSLNCVMGPNMNGDGFTEDSGLYLLAGEKSKEKETLEKIIGRKAPRTGEPTDDFATLKALPEYADLAATMDDDTLADLLPRLQNLSENRTGKIIFGIDEATGVVDSVYTAYTTNIRPGNAGHVQMIMAGNPNLHWDVFGLFCAPKVGWENVSLNDDGWETKSGGRCIRFNAEKNSRIVDKNPRISWMLTQKEVDEMAESYGKKSPYYYRFVLGMWCPAGTDFGIYSQADIELSGSMRPAMWGYRKPELFSSLDPSFTAGGDRASCTFFKYGEDTTGRRVMEIVEQTFIAIDVTNKNTPVPYQVVHGWRKECERRKVRPRHASFDATGGGVTFAAIVHKEWSSEVTPISSGGKASARPVGSERNSDGTRLLGHQRFANKATEMWYGAHPFLRTGQIRGISTTLAKELCSRKLSDKGHRMGRTVAVETKKDYIAREGHSPDDSDSFLVGLEHVRAKHGFRPVSVESPSGSPEEVVFRQPSAWDQFKARARKLTVKTNQRR